MALVVAPERRDGGFAFVEGGLRRVRQLRQTVRTGHDSLSCRLSVKQVVVEFFGDFSVSCRDGVFPRLRIKLEVNFIDIKAIFPVVFHGISPP